MPMTLRLAQHRDIPALDELIPLSVRVLQAAYYSPAQIEGALGTVFAVDSHRRRYLFCRGRRRQAHRWLWRME